MRSFSALSEKKNKTTISRASKLLKVSEFILHVTQSGISEVMLYDKNVVRKIDVPSEQNQAKSSYQP